MALLFHYARTCATLAFAVLVTQAAGQIPVGFEVVEVAEGPTFHAGPRLNQCGEFVYFTGYPWRTDSEIWLYDNGAILRVTDNTLPDATPDINDDGTIVWMRDFDGNIGGEIMVRTARNEKALAPGQGPSLNQHGAIAFEVEVNPDCPWESFIALYDGVAIQELIQPERSNQLTSINDAAEVMWTRYDFSSCSPTDFTSEILLSDSDGLRILPSGSANAVGGDINNFGEAVWSADFDFVELYQNGETSILSDGALASINDHADVAFSRWGPYWVAWAWIDGQFYRLSFDPPGINNFHCDINNDREVAWAWDLNPETMPGGIRFMRRVRNGDVDFDHDVDLSDFAPWIDCLTGPGEFDHLCRCRFEDMQHDRDVDLGDFARLQNTWANPQYPGHECCDGDHGPGCNDREVRECVCAVSPTCCTVEWNDSCVILVELLGCGTCQ